MILNSDNNLKIMEGNNFVKCLMSVFRNNCVN